MSQEGTQMTTFGTIDAEKQNFSFVGDVDTAVERALLRKIDFRLIPYLSLLYLLSFLDRANIGNAKIEGLVVDLKMTDQQYLWALTAFFFPYAFFEIPSNILLKKLKPSIWIPSIMLAWGTCTTLMGLVKNFESLLTVRLFLGVAEAGLFPGVTYYFSCWYKKREYGLRAAIFFSAATISGAFGGLLAAGIARMDGVGELQGWAWIFILEGIVTVLAGVGSFWIVPDFPDTATFLTPAERGFVIARLQEDKQLSAGQFEEFNLGRLWNALSDWKTIVVMIINMGIAGPIYGFSLFLPSIIKELGYTSTHAQLLSVPPYVIACLLTVAVGFASDRTGKRGRFNMIFLSIAIIGYIFNIIPSTGPALRYGGMYLVAAGVYPCVANNLAWISNNVEGSYKRGIVLATVISWGNLQGVVSSHVYRAEDAPHYLLGHSVMVTYVAISLSASMFFWFALRAENRKRDKGLRNYRTKTGTAEEKMELGDQHPEFRYTT